MQHLFGPDGEAALAAALRQRPLLAFDFDGTLTPIVPRAEDARLSAAVSARLKALAKQLPLAIVTGRAVADVRDRLFFEPQFLMGSHGAEDPRDPAATAARTHCLDSLRQQLLARRADLVAAGILVEDKGASVALHYRLSHQREQALTLIFEVLQPSDAAWRVFGGKMVVNAVAHDAPDKAAAVHTLAARCGARCAIFAGDDLNDETVFDSAPRHWLTIRIGRSEGKSRARYFLESPNEMAMLLERMLMVLPTLAAD